VHIRFHRLIGIGTRHLSNRLVASVLHTTTKLHFNLHRKSAASLNCSQLVLPPIAMSKNLVLVRNRIVPTSNISSPVPQASSEPGSFATSWKRYPLQIPPNSPTPGLPRACSRPLPIQSLLAPSFGEPRNRHRSRYRCPRRLHLRHQKCHLRNPLRFAVSFPRDG